MFDNRLFQSLPRKTADEVKRAIVAAGGEVGAIEGTGVGGAFIEIIERDSEGKPILIDHVFVGG